ncbi:DUF4352 domain-containing protein [Akkermansiaceae bacterium]|nr:DUF4352 domain-containing protein [Akkermansiaceae bacterium]
MKRQEIITAIVAIALIGAFIGGLKLSGGQKAANESRITELETHVSDRDQAIKEYETELTELTNSRNKFEEKLKTIEAEVRQKDGLVTKLQSELNLSKRTVAALEEKERQRLAGVAATPENAVTFTDPRGAVTVEILQVLTGNQTVAKAKLYEHSVADLREQGKEVIYFEIKITNNKVDGELDVSQSHFKLESTKGDTFSVEQTLDYIRGDLHQGRSARGGIAFAIYPDSVPHILRYNAWLRDGLGNELEAVSPNLREAFRSK